MNIDPYRSWDSDEESQNSDLSYDEIIQQLKADLHIVKEDNKRLVREANRLNSIVKELPEIQQAKHDVNFKIWRVQYKSDQYTKACYVLASDFNSVCKLLETRGIDKETFNLEDISKATEVIY